MYIRMLTNTVFKFRVARTNGINLNCAIEKKKKNRVRGQTLSPGGAAGCLEGFAVTSWLLL